MICDNSRKSIRLISCILIILVVAMAVCTSNAMAATKSMNKKNKHVIGVPNGGWVTINTSTAVSETYSDSGTKRNFTKHHLAVLFTSPNASSVTGKLTCSMGQLVHYNPNKVVCKSIAPIDSVVVPRPYVAHRHKDSKTKVTHKKNSSGYCYLAYMITGGVNPVSKGCKFTGITK